MRLGRCNRSLTVGKTSGPTHLNFGGFKARLYTVGLRSWVKLEVQPWIDESCGSHFLVSRVDVHEPTTLATSNSGKSC